jgi:hypothetical protein
VIDGSIEYAHGHPGSVMCVTRTTPTYGRLAKEARDGVVSW